MDRAGACAWGPRRILMLAPCPYPAPLGTAVCIRQLAHALAAQGNLVHLVTYAASHVVGVLQDGLVTCHAVPGASVAQRSGPQRGKMQADWHLLRYACRLGRRMGFDVVHGHHVEGIALGHLLRRALDLPLVGHIHTRLHLELPSYVRTRALQVVCAALGYAADCCLPKLVDALVTLNALDAELLRPHAPQDGVYVRYPSLGDYESVKAPYRTYTASEAMPAGSAIYSGNVDGYQNLALLAQAAHLTVTPIVVATHASTLALAHFDWPASTHIVRVDSFEQMIRLLDGATVGLCPRRQVAGYPIKWLNYWQARLPLVALEPVGRAVFGNALHTDAHGPALWVTPFADAFARGIDTARYMPRQPVCTPASAELGFAQIYAFAARQYAQTRLKRTALNRFKRMAL